MAPSRGHPPSHRRSCWNKQRRSVAKKGGGRQDREGRHGNISKNDVNDRVCIIPGVTHRPAPVLESPCCMLHDWNPQQETAATKNAVTDGTATHTLDCSRSVRVTLVRLARRWWCCWCHPSHIYCSLLLKAYQDNFV